jgi:hypothetical protein
MHPIPKMCSMGSLTFKDNVVEAFQACQVHVHPCHLK